MSRPRAISPAFVGESGGHRRFGHHYSYQLGPYAIGLCMILWSCGASDRPQLSTSKEQQAEITEQNWTSLLVVSRPRNTGYYDEPWLEVARRTDGTWCVFNLEKNLYSYEWNGTGYTRQNTGVSCYDVSGDELGIAAHTIGSARPDGQVRIYWARSTKWASRIYSILETSYESGAWRSEEIARIRCCGVPALTTGAPRGVGQNRLYVIYKSEDSPDCSGVYRLEELRWSEEGWSRSLVDGSVPPYPNGLLSCDARGEGRESLYTCRNTGNISEYGCSQFTWNQGWYREDIKIPAGPEIHGFALLRNGQRTLFGGTFSGFLELCYTGGTWQHFIISGVFTWWSSSKFAAGFGRGDDVMRVYAPGTWGYVEEATFRNGAWTRTGLMRLADDTANEALAIGPGRNDGRQRVYVAKFSAWSSAALYELTFTR